MFSFYNIIIILLFLLKSTSVEDISIINCSGIAADMSSEGEIGANASQGSLPPQDQSKFPGRKGHRKSLMQATMAESMKLKLLRAKAIRDAQKERIDQRHQYILSFVADSLKLDSSVVADYMLDGDQVKS